MGGSIPDTRRRFGVVAADDLWPAWQVAALRALVQVEGAELALVVDVGSKDSASAQACATGTAPLPADPLQRVSAAPILNRVPRCRPQDAAAIAEHSIDFFWCPDPGIIPPDRWMDPPGGFWALEVAGGDPSCTWALLRATATIPARLLRMGQGSNRACVLTQGRFRNEPFAPALTRARVLYGCAQWPARQLRAWMLQGVTALQGEATTVASIRAPTRIVRAALPFKQVLALARRMIACCYREQWAIGLTERPITALLKEPALRGIDWLPHPASGFHADPFGVRSAEGTVLLAEGYDAGRRFGRIDALLIHPSGHLTIDRDVLPCDGHVSYPYLLENDGKLYCVPETHQQRRVALYRAEQFPKRWTLEATLIDDFSAVDPTLIRHGKHWWLFCSNQDDEPYGKLYGFFADALSGPWTGHPLNPLKCDPSCSRPAGTPFIFRGALYRPAQDCSRSYGGAVVINRVEVLSTTAFSEVPVARIAPDPASPYPHGVHTLSSLGGRVVLDGKRMVFAPLEALPAARHFIGRLRSHRSGRSMPSAGPQIRGSCQ